MLRFPEPTSLTPVGVTQLPSQSLPDTFCPMSKDVVQVQIKALIPTNEGVARRWSVRLRSF